MNFTKSNARVIMLSSFLIFLSNLFGLSTNAATSGTGDWVVPEKRLWPASALGVIIGPAFESSVEAVGLPKKIFAVALGKESLELAVQSELEERGIQKLLKVMFMVKIRMVN